MPNPEMISVPKSMRDWYFFPIEMPVTALGHGPATVGDDAVKVTYEVWDRVLNTHGSHDFLVDAIDQALALIVKHRNEEIIK